MSTLYEQHRELLAAAREACARREAWSPYPEMPERYPDAEAAQARGRAAFEAHRQRGRVVIDQPGVQDWVGRSRPTPRRRWALSTRGPIWTP